MKRPCETACCSVKMVRLNIYVYIHTVLSPFHICPYFDRCGREFETEEELWEHQASAHKERKIRVQCQICNESFARGRLKDHIRIVHENLRFRQAHCSFLMPWVKNKDCVLCLDCLCLSSSRSCFFLSFYDCSVKLSSITGSLVRVFRVKPALKVEK